MLSFEQMTSGSGGDQGTHSRVRKKRTIPIPPPSTIHSVGSDGQPSTSPPLTQVTPPPLTQVASTSSSATGMYLNLNNRNILLISVS